MAKFYVNAWQDQIKDGRTVNTGRLENYPAFIEAETLGEAFTKHADLVTGPVNAWNATVITAEESPPPERFFGRVLTSSELAEATALAYGETWDAEEWEAEQAFKQEAFAKISDKLNALLSGDSTDNKESN